MQQLHAQMTQAGVLHTYVASGPRAHGWFSGWLDGAITGLQAAAGSTSPIDLNEGRVSAYGLRRPARFAFRPGTSEVWLGDRGTGTVAEVNRVGNAADGTVDNFGWPCAVGSGANSSYAGTAICQGLAASPAVQAPALTYTAGQPLFSGDTCQTASGSEVTGVAFAGPGAYPASYAGALFLADRLRRCVWAVPVSASGQPSPRGASVPVLSAASNPVNLEARTWGRALLRRSRRRHHSTAHLRERRSTADRHHSGGTSHLRFPARWLSTSMRPPQPTPRAAHCRTRGTWERRWRV